MAFVHTKDMAMSTNTRSFSIVTFQDDSVAVVRTDPGKPRFLELVAIFYDASHARDYADRENTAALPNPQPHRRRLRPGLPVRRLQQHRN